MTGSSLHFPQPLSHPKALPLILGQWLYRELISRTYLHRFRRPGMLTQSWVGSGQTETLLGDSIIWPRSRQVQACMGATEHLLPLKCIPMTRTTTASTLWTFPRIRNGVAVAFRPCVLHLRMRPTYKARFPTSSGGRLHRPFLHRGESSHP